MIISNPKQKSGFIPSFPTKIKKEMKKNHYRKSSMVLAIEHFKKQLNKLDTKKTILKQIEGKNMNNIQSMKLIDLNSFVTIDNTHVSPILPLCKPIKQVLPPLEVSKKVIFNANPDIICKSHRAREASQEKLNEKVLQISKSYKSQQIPNGPEGTGREKMKENKRKRIFIEKMKQENNSTPDSSPSPTLDPVLTKFDQC